jgi:hypothetical protein
MYSEKTRPSATLSTTNPTWPDQGSKPGHRSGKPATNRLSYGSAFLIPLDLTMQILGKSSKYEAPNYAISYSSKM